MELHTSRIYRCSAPDTDLRICEILDCQEQALINANLYVRLPPQAHDRTLHKRSAAQSYKEIFSDTINFHIAVSQTAILLWWRVIPSYCLWRPKFLAKSTERPRDEVAPPGILRLGK